MRLFPLRGSPLTASQNLILFFKITQVQTCDESTQEGKYLRYLTQHTHRKCWTLMKPSGELYLHGNKCEDVCVHRAHWQYRSDASWIARNLRGSDRQQLNVQHWEYLLLHCQQDGWAAHPAAFPLLSGLLQHLLSWSPPSTTRYKSRSLAAVTAGMLTFSHVRATWPTWQLALPLANNCIKTQYNGQISIGNDNQEYAGGLFTVQSITTELCPLHHLTSLQTDSLNKAVQSLLLGDKSTQ